MIEMLRVMGRALRLDPALFSMVDDRPYALLVAALGIAILAAGSTMLGHVAVLSLNRVRGLRLLAALLLSTAVLAVLKVVEMSITWSVASLVLGRPVPLVPLVVVALLSTAPLVFNFVTAMPHFGLAFGRVFEAWSYLLVLVGVSHAFGVSITWAFGFTLAGWLVIQVISKVGQRPFSWVSSHLWTLATGRPTMVTSRDILSGTPLIPVSGLRKEVER